MASLSKELRRQLEKTIAGENGARQIAEAGAVQSLRRLAVDHHEPHTSLTPEERNLRNQLRAHGRQLGDKRDPQRGTQTITHLKQAVAYEHWHHMLFARFLAENDLLLHPEHGVALSLDEVKELALGLRRDWIEVAAEYAQRMLLREVFRPDDPVLRVPLPLEKRGELEGKLNSLPVETFLADDSLGWVYQLWQRDAKEAVLSSQVKIGADEIAPVTQLFTEDYMVLFLLENTLGAWWTTRHASQSLPGYVWSYLRISEDGSPIAGSFSGWPKRAKDLQILDPCMGSGHFLTFALPIVARMRAAEEGLTLTEAVGATLRDNLFGLELDARCSQIAAFNLALTAWTLAGQHFELPKLNLACSGLGINAKEEDWIKLAGEDSRYRETMGKLFKMFSDAPSLGSLVDPFQLSASLFAAEFTEVRPLLEMALAAERTNEEARELAIAARGLLAAARILSDRFTLVITNVPYLGRGKQGDILKSHCEDFFNDAKTDLSTCFVDRCLRLCAEGGSAAVVTPQNWHFQSSYSDFRKRLLKTVEWRIVAKLGPNAFRNMNFWAATTALQVISKHDPSPESRFAGIDVGDVKSQETKAEKLQGRPFATGLQRGQLSNPDSKIIFGASQGGDTLATLAFSTQGIKSGDDDRLRRHFFEFPSISPPWIPLQTTVRESTVCGGFGELIDWSGDGGLLARKQGLQAWGKPGVMVSHMRHMPVSLYMGGAFDSNASPIVPRDPGNLLPIYAFCESASYAAEVRRLDQAPKPTNSSLVQVPFDLERWTAVARERYPSGLPPVSSSDPAQLVFSGDPKESAHPLQVAVARLLGYEWPRQQGDQFLLIPPAKCDGLEEHADADGIVCLCPVAGREAGGARLRAFLRASYGAEYSLSKMMVGKRANTIEDWLRLEFFEEHCRVFHHRPFIWHVWDGLDEGFHALINYHKLDRKNLEKLTYSYLGDWLKRCHDDVRNGVEGADALLAAAEHLQGELRKILEGEAPYDIFVRWKPLSRQPIGWDPDLNDGVRVNLRPWITAARVYKSAKPGILRIAPNINYTKDSGKEPFRDPNDFPWFRTSADRINDHHVSLEDKRQARGLE